jgi:hypothetical protein
MEETKRQAEEARRAEEARKAEMARKAEEARRAAKLSVEGIVDVAVKGSGATVDATMKKPAPPPMVSPKKTAKTEPVVETRNEKISVAPPEQVTYTTSGDDEYEIYEEYISFDDRVEEEEVAPADFGRLSYIDLYDNNDDSDDDFVFSEAEEEKEDDGEFNYGVKVVRKRKRQDADTSEKAPVKEIVLTDENAPAADRVVVVIYEYSNDDIENGLVISSAHFKAYDKSGKELEIFPQENLFEPGEISTLGTHTASVAFALSGSSENYIQVDYYNDLASNTPDLVYEGIWK